VRDRSGNPLPDGNVDQRDTPCLVVHGPPPVEEPDQDWYRAVFPKGSRVYPNHGQLWLAARLLAQRGGWRQPEHARALIEGVYGEDSEAVPPALAAQDCRSEGDRQAERDLGRLNGLRLEEDYAATPRQWLEDTRTPTRLGEQTTTVRLARWDGVELRPWYPAEEHAWELSQVSIRSALISAETEPTEPLLKAGLAAVKERLPDRGKWSVLVVLTEVTAGIYRGDALDPDGQPVEIRYSRDDGLWY
jgi:CRISPR-associated endonuclease/helicase Cas3